MDSFAVSESAKICDIENCQSQMDNSKHFLKLLNQNIRSISCNMPGLETLIARSKIHWDIMVLTECWLKSNPNIPILNGYNRFATSNNIIQNDGVVIYVNNSLSIAVEEPSFAEANCLVAKFDFDVVIIAIYRSPSYKNLSKFQTSLDNILAKYSTYGTVILTGDININISGEFLDVTSSDYLELAAYHGLLPAHTIPTRLNSCLDHILLKTKAQASTYVVESSVTDHETVVLFLKLKQKINYSTTHISTVNHDGVFSSLKNVDFKPLFESKDVDFAADYLISSVAQAVASNTKLVALSKRKRIIKPWITPGLLRCMRNRDNLHRKAKKDPNNTIVTVTYKRYRNYCNNLLKKLKRDYEKCELDKVKNNPKLLWKTINIITNRKEVQMPAAELITNNTDTRDTINKVNDFFVNVGRNLAENIITTHTTPNLDTADTSSSLHSMVFLPTDEGEVERLILSLKSNAEGWDNISGKVLKSFKEFIVPPLTYICNLAITSGIFPRAFKKALIIPVHKSGSRDRVDNYRPISILPSMSKILEKIMNTRLITFLEAKGLLSSSQFGFRAGVSTENAVHELTNYIFQNIDEDKKCLAIFLDLAKAFDTVSIPLLIKKLERIGVRDMQLRLFGNFLNNRTQYVRIGDVISDDRPVSYGIPQGSILGPTLFLVYVNELCKLELPNGRIISFADDTALTFSAKSWEEVFSQAQHGFDIVNDWLCNNVLTLNSDKTKYITFTKRGYVANMPFCIVAHKCLLPHDINCNCSKLESVRTIKYLGIYVDNNLNFNKHVDMLVPRIRKLIYIFKNLRNVADHRTIKVVYTALCQSILCYCITIWGGTHKTTILKLERAQRAVLKTSQNLHFLFPTSELYKLCKVHTVRQLYIMRVIAKVHSELPYEPSIITSKRRKDIVCRYRQHTTFSHRAFSFLGGFIYNKCNKMLNLYPLNKKICKLTVSEWLLTLDYVKTEDLLLFKI